MVSEIVLKVHREVLVVKWQRQLGIDVHVVDSELASRYVMSITRKADLGL